MRFNRFQFAQATTASKDCTQCKEMKDYGACTCDPEMSTSMPPNQESCTFVLGNENAPAQNAKPAWSEYATSNTVRAAEGTLEKKRARRAAKAQQTLFGQGGHDYSDGVDCNDEMYSNHPMCKKASWGQDAHECPEGDTSAYCLTQVEQDTHCDPDENPNAPGCDVFSQYGFRPTIKGEEVMAHKQGMTPEDEEDLWGQNQQDALFKQGAEMSASRCIGPSGPDCDLNE